MNMLELNKKNVVAFYDLMFNQSKPREAMERFASDTYIQHNPGLGKRVHFKRVVAEGNYVVLHCHQDRRALGCPADRSAAVGQRQYYVLSVEYYFDEGCFITELSNTPEHPDLSIARARVPIGVTTRWHRVNDTAERYVILDGRGRAEVGEQPPREVGPGDVVVIAASQRQRIANIGDKDLVFLAICTPRFERAAYEDLA